MQLLASDYDGTLKQYSDKEKELTVEKRDKEAIDEFRERGNLFGIVTGRSKGMIDLELKKYGIEIDFLIAQNGSVIWSRDSQLLYVREISHETAAQLADVMKEKKVVCFGAAGLEASGILYDNGQNISDSERKNMRVESLTEEAFRQMTVISFFIKNESGQAAELLAEELARLFDGCLSFHCNKDVIDVTAYGVSKETGVRWIEKYYRPDQIAVIGDALNDLSMIRAYHGYYITSGCDGLKQYAKRGFANMKECLMHMMGETDESEGR